VPPASRRCATVAPTDHSLLEAMRPRFADVLDALDVAGYAKDELVVAWDFNGRIRRLPPPRHDRGSDRRGRRTRESIRSYTILTECRSTR